jgi:hypothetical protein
MKSKSLCAIAAAAAVAGCGSSDQASVGRSAAGPGVARTDVIARADAICKRLNTEFAESRPIRTMADIARSVPHRAAVELRVVEELSALAVPAGRIQGLKRIIAYRKALAQELAELGMRAKRDDSAAVQTLGKSKARLHKKLREAARAAGFTECGSTGPT